MTGIGDVVLFPFKIAFTLLKKFINLPWWLHYAFIPVYLLMALLLYDKLR